MAHSVLTNLQKALSSVGIDLALTGRYGSQKVAVLGGYIILSLVTVTFAFSSSEPLPNPIGASIEPQTISTTGERWFLVNNHSDEDWTRVTLLLNEHFIHRGPESVARGEAARIFVKDFDYTLYVPRAQHFGTLEDTSESPPGPKAPRDLAPDSLVIITEQGSHSVDLGKPKPPPEPAEEADPKQ